MSDPNPNPLIWPKCSNCGVAFVLRRVMRIAFGDWVWLWQRDCKHKTAEAVIEKEGETP